MVRKSSPPWPKAWISLVLATVAGSARDGNRAAVDQDRPGCGTADFDRVVQGVSSDGQGTVADGKGCCNSHVHFLPGGFLKWARHRHPFAIAPASVAEQRDQISLFERTARRQPHLVRPKGRYRAAGVPPTWWWICFCTGLRHRPQRGRSAGSMREVAGSCLAQPASHAFGRLPNWRNPATWELSHRPGGGRPSSA